MSEKSNYLKSYIGKRCKIDIASWHATYSGTITKCEDGWITFETRRAVELINIDRINIVSIKR